MSNLPVLPRLLAVLHSLPLWILVGLAVAGYAALFAPAFGDIDLTALRRDWGAWLWLYAVTFTILSATYSAHLVAKAIRARARRRRRWRTERYYRVYVPLFVELIQIHITSVEAPLLKQRVRNAWQTLRQAGGRKAKLQSAWKALFDIRTPGETGKVDYGGIFPFSEIRRVVESNVVHCDTKLVDLVSRARNTRMEDGAARNELTYDDLKLYDHILNEHSRLKKFIER